MPFLPDLLFSENTIVLMYNGNSHYWYTYVDGSPAEQKFKLQEAKLAHIEQLDGPASRLPELLTYEAAKDARPWQKIMEFVLTQKTVLRWVNYD